MLHCSPEKTLYLLTILLDTSCRKCAFLSRFDFIYKKKKEPTRFLLNHLRVDWELLNITESNQVFPFFKKNQQLGFLNQFSYASLNLFFSVSWCRAPARSSYLCYDIIQVLLFFFNYTENLWDVIWINFF